MKSQRRRASILIVEDERIIAKNIEQLLTEIGHDGYAIAASADEALVCAARKCPDLALVDVRIKGSLDGIQLAQILRDRFCVPVVYLTAHADEATIERAKETEPYGYLVKPIKTGELTSAIEIALYKHESERRLQEREHWFSTAMRSIADAVISVDLAGRVTFMNAAAELLTGKKLDAALGRPAQEVLNLVEAEGRCLTETPLEEALHARHPVHVYEARIGRGSEPPVLIADSAAPVIDRGELLGAIMVFRDVTAQRRMERQLELADRLASLGTMAAGVAHEINNPLTVVVANAEFAREAFAEIPEEIFQGLPVSVREALEELQEGQRDTLSAAQRIQRIVADLRAFSRPAPVSNSTADVGEAVAWALRATERELKYRARVVTELSPVPRVHADATRLGQVLVNLLINAAQAIEPGHVQQNQVTLTVRTPKEQWVAIEVRDTGSGIPPRLRGRIFEPFFTTKPVGVGTGLGLSICHGIVTSLGGTIEVESDEHGSQFRVLLPTASAVANSAGSGIRPATTAQRARILVVDDEELVLGVLRRALAEHDVRCVGSAREALELLGEQQFDIILSDLMMPDMTGLELYSALSQRRPADAARVVFMTGGNQNAAAAELLARLPNAQLEKPFSMAAVRERVGQLLSSVERLPSEPSAAARAAES